MAQGNYGNRPHGQNTRPQHGGSWQGNNRGVNKIPVGKKHNFYLDSEKKKLDPRFVDDEAKNKAEKFGDRLKSTQLRRFYDDVKAIERKLMLGDEKSREAVFDNERAMIVMLKPKAVYAANRKDAAIPQEFLEFIFDNVDSIQDLRDFEAFVCHFEAVVAYHKFFAKD